MPLISKSIPNLLGGVSQQPDAVRYDNQCEAMDNSFPSVLDGLIKRPPTEHIRRIAEVSGAGASDNYFTHIIPLDPSNQFVAIVDTTPTTLNKSLGARDFDRSKAEHFQLADSATTSTGNVDFWLSAWFQVRADFQYPTLVCKGPDQSSAFPHEYYIYYHSAENDIRFEIGDGSARRVVDSVEQIALDTWYFIFCWVDRTAQTANLRLNGASVVETPLDGLGYLDNTEPFTIGCTGRGDSDGDPWDGLISKVGFGKPPGAWTPDTLHDLLYNNGNGTKFADISGGNRELYGLTAGNGVWFPLDEASGSAIDDVAGLDLPAFGDDAAPNDEPGSATGPSPFDTTITVQNLDGTAPTTVLVPDGTDYLTTASGFATAKDLRAITIADYTFIVNRSKVASMLDSTSPSRNPESLLYIKDGDYGTAYTAEIDTKKHRPTTRLFDGIDDYFEAADHADLRTGYIDFAFSMWVKLDTSSDNTLVNKYTGTGGTSEYNFYVVGSSGKLKLVVDDYDTTPEYNGEQAFDGTAITELESDEWQHIICEHKVTEEGADVTFTVNGISETIEKTNGVTISPETGTPFRLGARSGSGYSDGNICLTGFWKRVFVAEERTQLYNNGKGLLYTEMGEILKEDLISFWALDEASGDASDSHGSHDLTDNGTVGMEEEGLRGEGHVYKTEVTTPSGSQIKEFDEDGNLKAQTFDARDSIDTSVIRKAFSTGTASGYNSFSYPSKATNSEGVVDGGSIKEYFDGVSVSPGELVFVADATSDKISFVANEAPAGDTITDNGAGTNDFSELTAGDKISCTGSAEEGNNNTIFEIESITGSDKIITLTQSGVVTTEANETTVKIYKMDSNSLVGGTKSSAGIRNASTITKSSNGSVVHFKSSDGHDFDFSVTDGLANTALVGIKDEADRLTDLPTVAPHDFLVKIVGSAESTVDDYYAKFVSVNGAFGSGTWQETVSPGIEYEVDPSTMPHALVRQSDGVFRFAQFNGASYLATPTGSATPVKYTLPKWSDRIVGDLDTNPNPTFMGKKIRDIFLYKNRLGFLADESVILSETAEFFNFFRTTVLSLPDTATIDVASTHSTVSILTSAIPFSKQLILFSNRTQFVLGSGQSPFSPSTVSMTKTTSYDAVEDIRPLSLGDSIYFGFSRGDYVGLRQYEVTTDTESVFEAEDISIQVPQYIKGSLRTLTGSSHEDVIFVSTDENRNHLFCYKFFDQPDGGRVQSAWSRFIFEDDDEILGVNFIDTTLYLVIKREDGIFLEKMRLETGLVDSGLAYRTLLDRRISNTDITLSEGGTRLQLPYDAHKDSDDNMLIEIVTKDTENGDIGRSITVTATDDSGFVTVNEDLSSTAFFLGTKYSMEYTFSDVILRETTQEDSSALISQGRKQVRYITLDYHDTSYFTVAVKPIHRNTSTHPFTGRILGAGENVLGEIQLDNGQFRVPVYSENTEVTIQISNDSPLPCAITSAEFEMTFDPRSRRFA